MRRDVARTGETKAERISRHAGDMQEAAAEAAGLYNLAPDLPIETDVQLRALGMRVKAHMRAVLGEARAKEITKGGGTDFVENGIDDARKMIDGMLCFTWRETGTIPDNMQDVLTRSYAAFPWFALNKSQCTSTDTGVIIFKPELLAFADEQPPRIQIKPGTERHPEEEYVLLCGAFRKVPGREEILAQQLFVGVASIYRQCGNFGSPDYIEQRLPGLLNQNPAGSAPQHSAAI